MSVASPIHADGLAQSCGTTGFWQTARTIWAFRRSLCETCQKELCVNGIARGVDGDRVVIDAPEPVGMAHVYGSLRYWDVTFLEKAFPGVVDRRVFLCCPAFRKCDGSQTYSMYLRADIESAIELVKAADAHGSDENDDTLAQAIEHSRKRTSEGTDVC